MTDPVLMNCCLFVDVEKADRQQVMAAVRAIGGRPLSEDWAKDCTLRFDFAHLPQKDLLKAACSIAVRAATLMDAELEWLVGGPIRPGVLMWTLTETPTGDHHGPAH